MEGTTPSTTGGPASIDPARMTALVAGVLYLVTFISSIPSFFLLEPAFGTPSYVIGGGADTQVT